MKSSQIKYVFIPFRGERARVCVCVCVRARARARVCVCVCVCLCTEGEVLSVLCQELRESCACCKTVPPLVSFNRCLHLIRNFISCQY